MSFLSLLYVNNDYYYSNTCHTHISFDSKKENKRNINNQKMFKLLVVLLIKKKI